MPPKKGTAICKYYTEMKRKGEIITLKNRQKKVNLIIVVMLLANFR